MVTKRTAQALVICMLLTCCGCQTTEERIQDLAHTFRAKPQTVEAEAQPDYSHRISEYEKLVKLGAFQKGMSRASVEKLLGKDPSPWLKKEASEGFDLRLAYPTSGYSTARFYFLNDRLVNYDHWSEAEGK